MYGMRRLARPLMYMGVLAVVFGLAKAHAAWIGHYDFTGSSRFSWTMVYVIVLCVTAYGFGLPDVPRTRWAMLSSSVGAAVVAAGGMSVVQLVVGDALLPRFVVFGAALLLPDWYRVCVRLAAGGRAREVARERVAVIGTVDEIAALQADLDENIERPASIVAGLPLGDLVVRAHNPARLQDRLAGSHPSILVLGAAAMADPAVIAQVASLHERGARVRSLLEFYEGWLGKLPVSELERASLLFDIAEIHRQRYGRVKRLMDLALASAGLLMVVLVAPVVLLANSVGNKGPLLYRQSRVGRAGEPFEMLKFRTMTPSAGSAGAWTAHDDPRVTPFGRILRRSHIDELPQIINILRGELSVVGPRPEQPHYVEELGEKLPFYGMRHLVRPGLTGWAQVNYGYAADESDALEKLQYDFYYLRHQSLILDLRIVGRTIRSVLGRAGR